MLVRKAPALLVERPEQWQPFGVQLGGVRHVKFRQVNNVDPMVLECLHKWRNLETSGNLIGLLLFLLPAKFQSMLDVVVTRESQMAIEFRKAVAVCEPADFLQGLLGLAGAQQAEEAEVLLGVGRSIDPGDETFIAFGGLANAESPVVPLLEAAAVPDKPKVV